jgi:type I restriction enzyme S subunit
VTELLGNLCRFVTGGTPPKSEARFFEGHIPWITSADITQPVVSTARSFITEDAVSCSATNRVPAGTALLVTRTGVGKVAVAGCDLCFSQDITALIPESARLDTAYLVHFLRTKQDYFLSMARGATIKGITRDVVASIEMALPSLEKQRRIAAILDKADALRTKRREALTQLDRLAQSIFVEMFGDPVTNPKGWRRLQLGEIFGIARGGSPRPIDEYITDAADGVNWVMIGDTEQGGKYIWSTKKKIRPDGVKRSRLVKSGDFLLTNSMSFGRPYILKTSGCIHDGWLVLSPRITDFNADYFYTLLGSQAVFNEFSKRASGATVKNLNIDLVSGVEVAVPPLDEQLKFAKAVEAIEAQKSLGEDSASQLDCLFGSLQARAFSGAL